MHGYKTVCHGYSPLTAGGKVFSELEYGIPKLRNVGVYKYYILNILCYHSYNVLGLLTWYGIIIAIGLLLFLENEGSYYH